MKTDRNLQLFSRRRQHQQIIILVVLGVFITTFTRYFLVIDIIKLEDIRTTHLSGWSSLLPKCNCSKSSLVVFNHGECFFNQPICYPGFIGENCDIELKNETYRSHCPSDVHEIEWTSLLIHQTKTKCLQSQVAQNEWNTSCLFLCFYHRSTGIIQIPSIFWNNSLNNELNFWQLNPTMIDDRLYEHIEGFHDYKIIPLQIHSIIEVGAGPFTQVQYLLTPFRVIKQITLVDPNALSYMKLNNCAYRNGRLRGSPVSIISESVEVMLEQRRENEFSSNSTKHYSALIAINVAEHVKDALEYFRGLYDLLEDNGLIIFHERWYDYPQQGDCVLQNAEDLHPIRITKLIIDEFLNQFETLFINFNRTKRQMQTVCSEHGVYFIGRKKSQCQ